MAREGWTETMTSLARYAILDTGHCQCPVPGGISLQKLMDCFWKWMEGQASSRTSLFRRANLV